jgi:TonB-linked SusC/RagA family outer membrane protein
MRWISVLCLSLLLLSPQHASAQATGSVSGVVTGANDRPLAGAAVNVAGTTRGAQTGADGRYTITGVPAGSRTVRASFAGYGEGTRSVTVSAGATATANLSLSQKVVQLEEVVAVGYGTARKKDLTGSISSVSAEDLAQKATPTTSVASALVGRTPGVQVISNGGTPGQAATVRIRGTNSITAGSDPLYVVDGIPIGSIPLSSIDPNNIESMQILKDASATAIYGARGANGVVLVTTKRGARGTNSLSIESSYGYQKPTRFIQALNAQQFRILQNEGLVNGGSKAKWTQADIDAAALTTYDYPRALLNDLAWQPQQSHALTVSGGDQQTRYLVSGNFLNQNGLILNSGFTRVGGRVNLDRSVSPRFRIGSSLSGTRSRQELNGSNNTGSGAGNTGITTALEYDPSLLPQDPITGTWNQRVVLNENFLNPITEALNRTGAVYNTALLTSLFGEFDIVSGLALRSTFGGNFNFARSQAFSPSFIGSGNNIGTATQNSNERRELTNNNTLTYRRPVGPGTLEMLAATEIQKSNFEQFTAESRGFPVDQLEFYNLGAGSTIISPTSTNNESTLLSQLGRINYNLLERYLFTVTGRRDGSSRFGEHNKWATFPSAAFAWRVIDEPFLQNQKLFSDLKFRVSYGKTGNQAINPYQSLAQLSTVFFSQGTGTDVVTLAPTAAAGNPDLKWETQNQYNIGTDLGFLDNRVSLTVDAYQSNTSNLLLSTNQPRTTGFDTQLRNVGAVTNKGVELGLTTVNYEGSNFSWRTTLNLSRNRNKVTELYGGLLNLGAGSSTQVGEPLNTFVGYKVLGLYQAGDACPIIAKAECSPGEYKLQDTNGDGLINDNDRVNLGNPQADFYGGFSSNMSFGPLSMDAFFNFSKGNLINAQSMNRYIGLIGGASNERADWSLNRWTSTNTDTRFPRANINRPNTRTYSSYIEDGSFLRLQSLSFAYQLPTQLIPGGAVSNARLIVTGQNLWITTRYDGWDPENAGSNSAGEGTDNGGYPKAKTWNVGLNVAF